MASTASQDYVSLDKSREILCTTKTAYPAIVLCVFLLAFIICGVVNAPRDDGMVEIHAKRGPGGRPLPLRRKSASQVKEAVKVTDFSPNAKLTFRAISVAGLLTSAANGAAIVLQVLLYRDDRWWPGQSAVVSAEHKTPSESGLTKRTDLRGCFLFCLVDYFNILDRYQALSNFGSSYCLARFTAPRADHHRRQSCHLHRATSRTPSGGSHWWQGSQRHNWLGNP